MTPSLDRSLVDVISCSLAASGDEIEALRVSLSPDEEVRADAFLVDRARQRFVVAHARLRQILGALAGLAPQAVRLGTAPGGKPRLVGGAGSRLRFNLAHSGDLMLCALTLDHEVGVDVERVRDDLDRAEIARRFFAEPEARSLAALPEAAVREAFFACWTRKEAVVKATGEGLARPLDSFVVSVETRRARMLSADPALGRPEEWALLPVPVPPGYAACVAVRAAAGLRAWQWPVPWIDAALPR